MRRSPLGVRDDERASSLPCSRQDGSLGMCWMQLEERLHRRALDHPTRISWVAIGFGMTSSRLAAVGLCNDREHVVLVWAAGSTRPNPPASTEDHVISTSPDAVMPVALFQVADSRHLGACFGLDRGQCIAAHCHCMAGPTPRSRRLTGPGSDPGSPGVLRRRAWPRADRCARAGWADRERLAAANTDSRRL